MLMKKNGTGIYKAVINIEKLMNQNGPVMNKAVTDVKTLTNQNGLVMHQAVFVVSVSGRATNPPGIVINVSYIQSWQ